MTNYTITPWAGSALYGPKVLVRIPAELSHEEAYKFMANLKLPWPRWMGSSIFVVVGEGGHAPHSVYTFPATEPERWSQHPLKGCSHR